ncbi:TRAP-type C4-dicarboxylate transport system, substrate-binding protein [Tistlia consotensis]|uniref:TRAP-type C4-dicarboxylate transport system, substrate-binding protein n=1 Tax=Tistlia consotensis USBA 355 TaxID=560819 RepID=A0A1Y6CJB5_9PROT|nr:TRAP transporter substrate-binding protein DctP [Tistlia consotensis]SMF57103.1 TRAP-type C4-dicarboxylate transport system, substrate-binding protein [Tistlia consotensis USBA 355]SNR45366.1 TRAP-type C4-dicarboxylate transport system, substrate-binding protein [Tistlia consotensis]
MSETPRKNDRRGRLAALAAGLLIGASLAGTAQATELKLADQFPATHVITREGTQAFFDYIKAHPEADLSVQHFPGEQLGKANSMLDLVRNRVADIAMVGISYVTERMPLATLMELPGLYRDSFDGYEPFLHLAEKDLAGIDFDRNNVKLLWVLVTPPYQLLMKRSEPIASLADIEGMKTRVAGSTGELAAKALGLVPVKMAAPDLYVALERGTLDAAIYTLSAMRSYKLEEVTNSFTTNASLGGVAFGAFINKDVWNGLSDTQRKVLLAAGAEAGFHTTCALMKGDLKAQEALKGMGKAVYAMPDALVAQFADKLSVVDAEWQKQMAGRNLPGEQMMTRFRDYQKQARADGTAAAERDRCLGK